MVTQDALLQYRKEIKFALKGSAACKRSILENLDSDIEVYLAEHPEAGEAELRAYFGEPAAYAREYTATMSGNELHRKLSSRSFHKKLWLGVAISIVLIIAILAVYIGVYNNHETGRWYTYEIIEITK